MRWSRVSLAARGWPAVVVACLVVADGAAAQDGGVVESLPADAGVPEPAVDGGPAVTADELRALEQALAGDRAQDRPPAPVDVAAALPAAVQSLNPDIALILDVSAAWFSADEPEMSGAHDPRRTGFTLQQLEAALGASVDPYVRFDASLVFSLDGVELEEAYGTTLSLPFSLQARGGKFLTRFGRQNQTHPHQWSFVAQPLVVGEMWGGEGNQAVGAEVSWLAPLPWYLEVSGAVTNADGAETMASFLGADALPIETPLDLLYTTTLKQFFPFDDDLSLYAGVSTQHGPNASGPGNRSELYGADLYLRYKPVAADTRWSASLQMEAILRRRQLPGAIVVDGGGYAHAVWRVDPRWETGARYELLLQEPVDARHRGAVQLTFYPSHFSRLRLEGQAGLHDGAPDFAVMLQAELVAGAHGSHSF